MMVDLPRMDIAAFVGFAQRGPLDIPVVVESYANFVDIFGDVYQLAWDEESGIWQTACLAPAVKAFFTQGGQRCWIVRVVNRAEAVANQFPLAGLLQTIGTTYSPVVAQARSVGSWSDGLQVNVEPQFDRLSFTTTTVFPDTDSDVSLSLLRNQELQVGDLLQLDFADQYHQAYVTIGLSDLLIDREIARIKIQAANTSWLRTLQQPISGFLGPINSSEAVPANIRKEGEALFLEVNSSRLFKPDDWLTLNTIDRSQIWMLIKDVEAERENLKRVNLQGAWLEGYETAGPLTITRIQRVQLALTVRGESGTDYTLQNLACAASHPRFIGNLPDDDRLFSPNFWAPKPPRSASQEALWQEVQYPRFPISLDLAQGTTLIPLGLSSELPRQAALPTSILPLVRDGLVPTTDDVQGLTRGAWNSFWAEIFLDQSLRLTGQRSLMAEASDRLYFQGQSLTGLHALLPIEEISLIALTDAAHRGWRLTQAATVAPPPNDTKPAAPPDPCAKTSPFEPCASVENDINDSSDDSSGTSSATTSSPTPPEAAASLQWQLLPLQEEYDDTGLLEVQQALAKLAAARADLVGVLGVPKHYRLPETLKHQQRLLARVRQDGDTTDSYIALYHPWLVSRAETGELIHTHPAGSMAGVMASRSLRQGAWVAPANEVIQNALSTLLRLSLEDEQTLYRSGINPIRQIARGFVAWGSYTQSADSDLEDLNVRRLLILLRRLALREGQTYVFAPHSDAFRRRVQQQFEQVLARLFDLGAFAGRTPAEAYQVVIDDTLNTQNTIERGQLIVELRVAPSQPMTFITVRLVQTDSTGLTLQEVRVNGR